MTKVIDSVITAGEIDELASVREQIAILSKREKALKEKLRKDADGAATIYRGVNYFLGVTFAVSERLDMVAAREALGAEWCSTHTKITESMNIDVMAVEQSLMQGV